MDSKVEEQQPHDPQVKELNTKLKGAYKQLDKNRRKLKKVKSLVYHDANTTDEENDVYRESADNNNNDADFFKIREVGNQITYTN